MRRHWNLFLAFIFIFLVSVIFFLGSRYNTLEEKRNTFESYGKLSRNAVKSFRTLVEEKKNATLTICLAYAQDKDLKRSLLNRRSVYTKLQSFSERLKMTTDFKNVWFELVDANGTVVSRSYSKKTGDRLTDKQSREMLFNPHVASSTTTIDRGYVIEASVPLYEKKKFIGFLRTITHFNSIAITMQEQGFETIMLLDPKLSAKLVNPMNDNFMKGMNVVNKNSDRMLLAYLQKQDLQEYIDAKSYLLTKDGSYFVARYTCLESEKPAAYVFLFKRMSEIGYGAQKEQRLFVNSLMVLAVLVAGFLLFLQAETPKNRFYISSKMLPLMIVFALLFVVLNIGNWGLLKLHKESDEKEFLQRYNKTILTDYSLIYKNYRLVANTMFEMSIDKPDILHLMKKAYGPDKAKAREDLHRRLADLYDYLKGYNVRQLHFHLKNNESFLRFHRPGKFGDDLSNVRKTVAWVNANLKPIEGFEEGRIYNGFRYVFPLIDRDENGQKEHLGSVEISFSALAIAKEFASVHHAKVGFMVAKKVADEKLFKEEHSNYAPSALSGFYYEKAVKEELDNASIRYETRKLFKKQLIEANSKVQKGEIFTLVSKGEGVFFTFLPLRNPVTNQVVATLVFEVNNDYLQKQTELFDVLTITGSVLILLLLIFIFREILSKRRFAYLSDKTQSILNTLESIVIISDGKEISDANKKFLEFFGYPSLDTLLWKRSKRSMTVYAVSL